MGREGIPVLGDGGVVVGQLLLERQRLPGFGFRFRQPAHVIEHGAKVVVPGREVAAEAGDGRIVVD